MTIGLLKQDMRDKTKNTEKYFNVEKKVGERHMWGGGGAKLLKNGGK